MSLRYLVNKVISSGRDRGGFTLIEVLVALAVGSIVVAGASQVLQQMYYLIPKAENSMLAMRQVQFAGHWIDRDGLMAQVITPSDNVSPPPTHNLSTENLTMSHVEWNPSDNITIVKTVTYRLDKITNPTNYKLIRTEVITDERTGALKSGGGVWQVADSITSLTYTVLKVSGLGLVLTANITAQVSGASETRTYTTRPRSF